MAVDRGVDPEALVRRQHLGMGDLLAGIPGVEQLLAVYRLLAILAQSGTEPNLIAWQRPWRQPVPHPGRTGVCWLTLPAYAELEWQDAGRAGYLLLPDTGRRPLKSYRAALRELACAPRARGACPCSSRSPPSGG